MPNTTGIKRSCSKCGNDLKDRYGKYRYCLECHKAYMRKTRPKYSELSDEEKHKADVRTLANHALKDGLITRKPCEVCGKKAEMHHDDYNKPYDVKWLCKKHHIQKHKNDGKHQNLS